MPQFMMKWLGCFLVITHCHASAGVIELDDPLIKPAPQPEIAIPANHLPDADANKHKPLERQDDGTASEKENQYRNKTSAIDPDAEQVNRGALPPQSIKQAK